MYETIIRQGIAISRNVYKYNGREYVLCHRTETAMIRGEGE